MKKYKGKMPEITLKYNTGDIQKHKISSSHDAYMLFKEMFDADTLEYTESFIVIYLNRANNTIGWHRVSSGGMSGTVADGKVILATALKCGASAMILAHNHPSGALKPSQSDIQLTKKLKEVSEYIDLMILDHLIISADGFYSFADEGMI